jgi:hypothetical protein
MRNFPLAPSGKQMDAYNKQGFVVASPCFELRHKQFERWCGVTGRPLVIIWPQEPRRRIITMQMFRCTVAILDAEFKAHMRNLAEIWGAIGYEAGLFPVRFEGVTPRHARVLSGYLHGLAIEAYKRRAARIKDVLVVSSPKAGAQSDGHGPDGTFYGSIAGSGFLDHAVVLALDNGERYKIGFTSPKAPSVEFIRQQFADNPNAFSMLPHGSGGVAG